MEDQEVTADIIERYIRDKNYFRREEAKYKKWLKMKEREIERLNLKLNRTYGKLKQ